MTLGTRLDQIWRSFAFPPMSPYFLCLGRILFFTSFIYFYDFTGNDLLDWMQMPAQLWRPISFFQYLPQLHLGPHAVMWIVQTWKIALVHSLLGLFTRLSTLLSFFLSLLLLGYAHNFGKIHHSGHLPLLVLGVLAFSRCGETLSLDWAIKTWFRKGPNKKISHSEFGWPVRLIQIILALTYFEAGFQKLSRSGLEWMSGENISAMLLSVPVVTPLGVWVASHPWMCTLSGCSIIGIQLSGIISLFIPRVRWITIPGVALFHTMSYLLMGMYGYFFGYLVCLYFWLPPPKKLS